MPSPARPSPPPATPSASNRPERVLDATLPLFDDYTVSLEAFEGPLDLLLHLIRKEEVDI